MQVIDKIKRRIVEDKLIEDGDKVVVAISGGPDSVCLLHGLSQLQEEYHLQLYGAHLNHNFRGIEALKDAQYVTKLCERLNIMSFVKSIDVAEYAKNNHRSLEEAGRILRYAFFDEVAEKVGATKIAVAHNQNDQAETVLMRLLRGTGLQGLTAIHHKRGKIIRPLLDITRDEIEGYCITHQLQPRIDLTNLEPIYHRNKIRLELIPMLEKEYNPNLIEALSRMAETLKADHDFIQQQAQDIYGLLAQREDANTVILPVHGINKLPRALFVRVIRCSVEALVGKGEILEYRHIENLQHLVNNSETGQAIQLPMGITAKKSYHKIILTTNTDKGVKSFNYEVKDLGIIPIEEIHGVFEFNVLDIEDLEEIPRTAYVKVFDWDQISRQLIIRNRRDGDRFMPLGLKGSKKLKDFFIDRKVEREERDRIPLVCDGSEVMWVVGYQMSDKYKVTNNTKQILSIEFKSDLRKS
ncbi:tRNA lysidine(34) synthetase TilS [Alkaliphilus hydrothermalis]|uniref:tRNA(Ile)-lysidine synthase n=1 Tax=Alkaliphilus hydrothermalis TaxID=1482730 RepID=A0ABS2NTR5_9FIRM|nr:tRNA lysidine(34) synthetase TilS [Alkaliphilus hydrothermalis]MBM7615969.1 tRNA(Ile)-lysidine synthase [Alkaliphilus hydrothermalis]